MADKKQNAVRHDKLEMLKRLKAVCERAKNIGVIIYGNPDPDALASAIALKALVENDSRKVFIGYTGAIGRPENASMIRQLNIPAEPVDEGQAENADLIALVDAQPQFFKDFKLPRVDIIIDHHPPHLDYGVKFADIRPEYQSTSSIMSEYLQAGRVRLTKRLASALLYGIKTDSRNFMNELSHGDVEALRWLRGKTDRDIVKLIEFSQFSRETLDYFSIALVRRKFIKGVMYAHLGPVPYSDVCVQVADFFIRVEQVGWALVTGIVGDTLIIVFRNDGLKMDAGQLARAAFDHIGSAGGHMSMGRAEVQQKNLPKGLLLTDNHAIECFILGELAKVDPVFAPILRQVRCTIESRR
jgi:nanoRNase/pAp phosphatase (c-di-AMP/oligoRNAs hydrolase)